MQLKALIGILWKPEYKLKLYYEQNIPNPEYKPIHWNCNHQNHLTELERLEMRKKGEFCSVCGRKIRFVKHKKEVIIKKRYAWVENYEDFNIDTLILKNPWDDSLYTIASNRTNTRKWLVLYGLNDSDSVDITVEQIKCFETFVSKFINSETNVILVTI